MEKCKLMNSIDSEKDEIRKISKDIYESSDKSNLEQHRLPNSQNENLYFTANLLKKHVLRIIENLIEPKVDELILIQNCKYLCKNDYYDITVERSIQNYCGYPICSNILTDLYKKRQQYKICLRTHQVFDITDRKMFCSNICFTSSNYLKDQLEELPLWMRESESLTKMNSRINLYKKSKCTFGDEIALDINLTKNLVRELHDEGDNLKCKLYCKDNHLNERVMKMNDKKILKHQTTGVQLDRSINFPYIKEEDLNSLRGKLSKLKINEKKPEILDDDKKKSLNEIDNCVKSKPILDKVIEKVNKIKF